tara:strand:- start:869 stop:1666 length:798 start_codon:yes stop_codon:yes gene_type:complete
MNKKLSVIIFTDLDGTLLHRDTFKFDEIKDYINSLISKGIIIIPNTSKTEAEIEDFNKKLDLNLPFISENGSAIFGLDTLNKNFPNNIVLSREKEITLKIFQKNVPENLRSKCKLITKMEKKIQRKIFGLTDKNLKNVLNRNYSTSILFKGNSEQKKDLFKIVKNIGLSLHEGGRVINLCDNVSKVKAMNRVIKMIKKIENEIKTIGVGDNYNDLDMLRNSNIACLVFNDQFLMEPININNCIVSKQSAPLGWEEVVKMALEKIK